MPYGHRSAQHCRRSSLDISLKPERGRQGADNKKDNPGEADPEQPLNCMSPRHAMRPWSRPRDTVSSAFAG